jgi:putative transcriptional regulator
VGITIAYLPIVRTGKAQAVPFTTVEAICDALDRRAEDLLQFAS